MEDSYFLNFNNTKDLADKNITFIYGDGGAFPNRKRLVCKQIGSTRHIVNGIGEITNDKILIFYKNKIFQKNL